MARFVLRYRGGTPEQAKHRLADNRDVVVLDEDGRNFLVEADEQKLRSALPDPDEWAVSAEFHTPPPTTPHPVFKRLRRGRGQA